MSAKVRPVLPDNCNASIKKVKRKRKKEGGGMAKGALHPDVSEKEAASELRMSRKINKLRATGHLKVDNSKELARQKALKDKLAADIEQRQADMRERQAAKEAEMLNVGRRMAGKSGRGVSRKAMLRRKSLIEASPGSAASHAIDLLDLTQYDLRVLKTIYEDIDADNSGYIDPEEFFSMLNDEGGGFRQSLQSPLTDKLFKLIDLDGNGELDFEEFVHLLATYAIYTKMEIARFIFDTFDTDGSGKLDENEFMTLVRSLEPDPQFPGTYATALREFDVNGDGFIDWGEFKVIFARFQTVFFPAFLLQDRIHDATLGHKRWLEILKRYNLKMMTKDYILQHNGGLPPVPGCTFVLKSFFCCARHPAEQLLNIDSRPLGFDGEADTPQKRLYIQCVKKFGFQPPQNRSKVKEVKEEPKTLGYAEWRVNAASAGQGARERAVPKRAMAINRGSGAESPPGGFFSRNEGEEQDVQHDEVAAYT